MVVLRLTNEEVNVFKRVLHEAQAELHAEIVRAEEKSLKDALREDQRLMERVAKKLDAVPHHRHAAPPLIEAFSDDVPV